MNFPSRFIRDPRSATVYDTSSGFLKPISSPEEFKQLSGSSDIAGNTTLVNLNIPPGKRFIRDPSNDTVYDTSKGYLEPISNPQQFQQLSGSSDIAGNTTVVNLLGGGSPAMQPNNQPGPAGPSPYNNPVKRSQNDG